MTNQYFLTLLVASGSLCAQSQQLGFIHGMVTDANQRVIPGIQIEMTSGATRCTVTSESEGKFTCQLKPGRYEVKASGANIITYRRAMIDILQAEHKFLNIRPAWVAPSDQSAIHNPQLSFISGLAAGDHEVLIQFQSRRDINSSVGQ